MNEQPQTVTSKNFEFKVQENGSLEIAILTKRFDATNTIKFKAALEEHSKQALKNVSVDLSAIEFMDSSGIGALLSIQKRMQPNAGPITLINPKPAVLSIIELLRLHKIFKLQKDI